MMGRYTHTHKHPYYIVVGMFGLCIALISSCNQRHDNSEHVAKKVNDNHFTSKSSEKEAEFVVETVADNFANLKFAELAIDNSNNKEIKEVAGVIYKDHEALIKELKGFANAKGIAIPLEENKNARKKLDDLMSTDKKNFDEKWCRELSNRHEKTIESLEDMWKHSNDEDLKKWINSALPGLRNDLVKLQTCHEKLTM